MTADSRRCQTIIGFAPTAAVGGAVFFLAATIGMVGMLVVTRCSRTPCLVHAMTVPGAENAFALTSASKAWNLSGFKAALAIAGPEVAVDLRRTAEEVSHGPSHLGIIAHAEAFRTGGDWLDLLQGLDKNLTLLGDLVAEHLPGVKCLRPQGTYLARCAIHSILCIGIPLYTGDLVTLTLAPASSKASESGTGCSG